MKYKTLVIVFLILISILSGCSVKQEPISTKTDFELKKECSVYIDRYEAQYTGEPSDPETQHIMYGKDIFRRIFNGVYYSRRLNSCIVVIDVMIVSDSNGEITHIPLYNDALTGVPVDVVGIKKDNPEILDDDQFLEYLLFIK